MEVDNNTNMTWWASGDVPSLMRCPMDGRHDAECVMTLQDLIADGYREARKIWQANRDSLGYVSEYPEGNPMYGPLPGQKLVEMNVEELRLLCPKERVRPAPLTVTSEEEDELTALPTPEEIFSSPRRSFWRRFSVILPPGSKRLFKNALRRSLSLDRTLSLPVIKKLTPRMFRKRTSSSASSSDSKPGKQVRIVEPMDEPEPKQLPDIFRKTPPVKPAFGRSYTSPPQPRIAKWIAPVARPAPLPAAYLDLQPASGRRPPPVLPTSASANPQKRRRRHTVDEGDTVCARARIIVPDNRQTDEEWVRRVARNYEFFAPRLPLAIPASVYKAERDLSSASFEELPPCPIDNQATDIAIEEKRDWMSGLPNWVAVSAYLVFDLSILLLLYWIIKLIFFVLRFPLSFLL